MNFLIWLFLFVLGLIGVLIMVSLTLPCYYTIEGEYWGKFTGTVKVRSGPCTYYWPQGDVKKQQMGSKKTILKNWQELRPLLKQEVIVSLIELSGRLLSKLRPQTLRLEGKLGFANPYYTGLLAAGLAAFPRPGVHLEPDFSGTVCHWTIHLEGRVCLGVLFYVIGRALLTQPLRPVAWTFLIRKKREKRRGWTTEKVR